MTIALKTQGWIVYDLTNHPQKKNQTGLFLSFICYKAADHNIV